MMLVRLVTVAAMAVCVLGAPAALAQATAQQKLETCNFGADEQKLTGAKRKAYIAKCTSNKDSPRGKAVGAPAGAPKPQ